jgi:hypothetical protein
VRVVVARRNFVILRLSQANPASLE